jgi:cullin-associated NEDD8-dissociated protein 1
MRLIERFGTSNPSPRFIKIVSKSFSSGKYVKKKQNISFGTGKYGDLAATIAAILLDSEAKTPALDADPSSGASRL